MATGQPNDVTSELSNRIVTLFSQQQVTDVLFQRAAATFELAFLAIFAALLVAIPVALLAVLAACSAKPAAPALPPFDTSQSVKDLMANVVKELDATASRARRAGVDKARIVLDPGLGFGKRKEQNSEILAQLGRVAELDYPVLVGPSKKSFLCHQPMTYWDLIEQLSWTRKRMSGLRMTCDIEREC